MKIAVASGKGGVGKSMLASALAVLFSRDKKVVAVDADVDAPNLHLWLGGVVNWDETKKISTSQQAVINHDQCSFCGKCVDICAFNALSKEKNVVEVNPYFCEGCGACEVICPQKAISLKSVDNAEIRINQNLGEISVISAQLYPGHTGSGKIVAEIIKRASKFKFEVMIIDCPAGTGCPVIASLKEANYVVLVTEPTPSGLSDLKRVLQVVENFRIPFGVVVNKWDVNSGLSAKIGSQFKELILGKISYNKEVFDIIAHLVPVMESQLPQKNEIKVVFNRLVNKIGR
jgi:MinD superfamily P-loop ATPase